MGMGAHTAVEEVTLVLFTTLGPAGAFACVLVAITLMAGKLGDELRKNLCHMMGLPLVIATVGLVASSTHLGTPSNALYVLTGVGRSPLSNEVVCTILFLATTGAFWLYSFSASSRAWLLCLGEAAVAALGLLCVGGISLAYNQDTIVTWAMWHTPATIWLGGLGASVPLFLLTAHLAHAQDALGRAIVLSFVVGAASCVACAVCAGLQWNAVAGMQNELLSVSELAPQNAFFAVAYVALSIAAYVMCSRQAVSGLAVSPDSGSGLQARTVRGSGGGFLLASLLALLALFTLRFAFYAVHMTVGISL